MNYDKCQIRHDYYQCGCDGLYPHAPGWQQDVEVYAPVTDPGAFDHLDRLNEDGTVTLRMTPSNWHAYNMSPDTYQMFTGDSWCESEIEHFNSGEMSLGMFGDQYAVLDGAIGRLEWDHFEWVYDHAAIVRELAESLGQWMWTTLTDMGLSCSIEVKDTWSPQFYNFTSDGFEIEVTCDPAELRGLTLGFDVDAWGAEHYQSYDGFASFVPSRLNETEWHAEYDGGFRIESLFAASADFEVRERGWVMALAEDEWEIYMQNVKITPIEEKIREVVAYEESGFTLAELEEWAAESLAVYQAGMEPLPMEGVA